MNIVLPALYKWLSDVVSGVKTFGKGKWHVIKSRRLVGKSIMIEGLLLQSALEHNHSTNYLVSPSFNQADKVFSEIKDLVDKQPFVKSINNMKRCIKFTNKSEIRCFSAELDEHLRGYTVSGILCIDECAYIKDSIIDLIMPWTNAHNAPIVFCSTPLAKAGKFWELYKLGLTGQEPKILCYDWTKYDCSALLSPETLEFYRKTIDPLKFKTDYLGEFLDNESAFFGNYDLCIKPKRNRIEGETYWFGIDWGSGVSGDYTAISILKKDGSKVVLMDLIYFNDKDPKQTINEIVKLVDEWKPKKVTVEVNSIGNVYYGLLRDELKYKGVAVVGFNTTNDSKDRIISKLQVMMQNNEIELYSDPELLVELSAYEMVFSKTGKRVMNAASGFHDDLIMSLAIGINSINSGNYCISFI